MTAPWLPWQQHTHPSSNIQWLQALLLLLLLLP
jgi:hypothetical protein